MIEQSFGKYWTKQKLQVIENYLTSYTTALKNTPFKTYYIDAFAGSGTNDLKNGEKIDGSAIRALKYPFDRYMFFEKDKTYFNLLNDRIKNEYLDIKDKINIYNSDCNDSLMTINTGKWKQRGWRGVIFLDPYAMDLSWDCLTEISKTEIFDIWYLFPFYAVNRNLNKKGEFTESNKNTISRILGTDDWENEIYYEGPQISFLDKISREKQDTTGIKNYILKRLGETFPTVSSKAAILKNDKNAPLFLLCFAGSNPAKSAQQLSLNMADHLLKNIEG